MNLADTLQTEGFNAQMTVSADSFMHLNSGLPFDGVLEVLPGIDPRMELGSDIRELCCLHIIGANHQELLAEMSQEDRIMETSQSSRPIWKLIRREDNPGDIIVKLWIVKVPPQDS